MVNAQEWLDKNFSSKKKRKEILYISVTGNSVKLNFVMAFPFLHFEEEEAAEGNSWHNEVLEGNIYGTLDLNDFVNLKGLYLGSTSINELKVDKCENLMALNFPGSFLIENINIGDANRIEFFYPISFFIKKNEILRKKLSDLQRSNTIKKEQIINQEKENNRLKEKNQELKLALSEEQKALIQEQKRSQGLQTELERERNKNKFLSEQLEKQSEAKIEISLGNK